MSPSPTICGDSSAPNDSPSDPTKTMLGTLGQPPPLNGDRGNPWRRPCEGMSGAMLGDGDDKHDGHYKLNHRDSPLAMKNTPKVRPPSRSTRGIAISGMLLAAHDDNELHTEGTPFSSD